MPRPKGRLIWLHGASVGESLSLLSVITALLKADPALHVMVTTGTVTSAKLMQDRLPDGAFHQYIPVDHPAWVKSFLDHWQPDVIGWAESEFWPNMLSEICTRDIPAVLLNARMSEKSFKSWRRAPGMIASMLQCFSTCLAQSQLDADRLKALGAKNVSIAANLKYAAAPLPCNTHALESLKNTVGGRKTILWACTHPGEEDIAAATHKTLKTTAPDLLTIIVPRHPLRGDDITAMLQQRDLTAAQRSKNATPSHADDIYIADTLGELGVFFSLCKTGVMGGSFADIGGHNPIEPAQYGCTILYGPHMYNFRTISADFENRHAALRVQNATMLATKLKKILQAPENYASIATAAQAWVEEKSHIADETAAICLSYLKNPQEAAHA